MIPRYLVVAATAAEAAREAGVPVRIVKHVSDGADEGAMAWPSLVEVSAVALGEWLRVTVT